MLIDSHAHLDDKAFDPDREELIQKLREENIRYVVNISACLSSIKSSMKLAEKHDFIYTTVGIHPCETGELNEDNFTWLVRQLDHPKVKAIGEIGLDYYWKEPSKEVQEKWFRRQLQLAHEVKLPVVIHSRDAAADTCRIMQEEGADRLRGVIHCYSYTRETAGDYLNWGYYFGIGGVSTFQNAKKLKEAIEYIPMENIVLETDSPYLAPTPHRGKRNSPLNLPLIAEAVAELKRLPVEKVVEISGENSRKLYGLDS